MIGNLTHYGDGVKVRFEHPASVSTTVTVGGVITVPATTFEDSFVLASAPAVGVLIEVEWDDGLDIDVPEHVTVLTELMDVEIATPANGQLLAYNGTLWVNYSLDLSGYSVVGHTHSYLPLAGGTLTGALAGTTADLDGAASMALRLRQSSAGPWSLDLYRSDLATGSKVFNGGGYWYFEHRPKFIGLDAIDTGNIASYAMTLAAVQDVTGVKDFMSTQSTAANTGQNKLEVACDGAGGHAVMAFHRRGQYAVNMGLDSDNVFRIGGWSASANRLTLDMNGNMSVANSIGIPGAYFSPLTGSYGSINLTGYTNSYCGIHLYNASGTVLGMYDTSGNGGAYDSTTGWHFYWNRGHTCLGVGGATTSASYKMYVSGGIFATTNVDMEGEMQIRSASPTIYMRDTNHYGAVLHNNSNILYVLRAPTDTKSWDSGPNGRYPMIMDLSSGDVTFSGNVYAYSDRRLKRNIEPIADALAKVETLQGVTFDHVETGRGTGLIAQDVQAVLPEAVNESKQTGHLTLAYGALNGLLVEAIKELIERVRVLEARP
jgi:hypothetical protein